MIDHSLFWAARLIHFLLSLAAAAVVGFLTFAISWEWPTRWFSYLFVLFSASLAAVAMHWVLDVLVGVP
jgi:hypothetical protein